jgi:hypothetical protein
MMQPKRGPRLASREEKPRKSPAALAPLLGIGAGDKGRRRPQSVVERRSGGGGGAVI